MKSLSDATNQVTQKNFSRKFVSIGRIVASWADIMGKNFADKATPCRILYRKPKNTRSKPQATLEIATSHADATLMHYQKDVILQRLVALFGEDWITDIKFVAAERNNLSKSQKRSPRPLTHSEKNHLSDMLGTVKDPVLHERLQSLGENMLRHRK